MKYLIIIPLLLLLGCNDSENKSSDSVTEEQDIIGTWVTNCYQTFNATEPVFSIIEYHITDEEISHTYNNYSDSECTIKYSGSDDLWEGYVGTYIMLDDVATTSGIDAKWLEVTTSVVSTNDLVVEIGLYQNNDELNQVLEEDGMYIIAIEPKYIKQ